MTLGQVEQFARGRATRAAECCLVVASRSDRQALLARAAEEVGWETVSREPASGWSEIHRGGFQLTLLDLQDCNLVELDELRDLARVLGARPGHLLVVCGNAGDPLEEVWVRQAGAWLYLPGVEDPTDLAMLCHEALHVAQRLQQRAAISEPEQHDEEVTEWIASCRQATA